MRLGSTPKGRDKQTGVVKLDLAYLALSASSRGAQLRRVALSTSVRHDTAGMAKPNTSQLLIVGVSTIVRCPIHTASCNGVGFRGLCSRRLR
ncbi:hypothetical protein CABS01_14195 [Colletotrichum abscissum]|uniref:uncharacterized protein n=1 Tax=Colletotrichum abscissum TaxID=1671311 RepID=UPI0027D62DDA|nr:uncharacterized protein CABS01_14195 [Colletotrichum abscissum]KAK1481997.1 hypothetical protein CABS01_14195 [Colletotrichum abscissum]